MIHKIYSKQIKVLNSGTTGNVSGVAFILNREIMNTENTEIITLIPSRAILMNTTWHQTNKISILNIYAPNNYKEHPPFWTDINDQLVYLAQ